jgi:ATP-binding cassette subfamily B protein
MSFYDKNKTGELLGRLSSDTAVIQNALSVNISMFVRNLAQALGGLVLLFITSAKLTFFILILIPPLAWLAARFGKKVKSISRQTQDALADSSAVAEEGISGIRTVKAFAQEDWESSRYSNRLEKGFNLSVKKIKEIAKFTGLISSLGLAAIVFIIWYGGHLVIAGNLSVGTLTSYLLYVMTVAFSVGMLGSLYSDFMSAFGAGERIFELLEQRPEINADNRHSGVCEIQQGKIEFINARFSYPARPSVDVLQSINFSIMPNETIALVGASGSGKTTIAQLILRFYNLNSGQLEIDGKNISEFNLTALRKNIGIVSQEPILVSESIEENIRYARPQASQEEVVSAAKLAHAHDFIVGLPDQYKTLVGEKGMQLSGGQKQRVAIARAILKNPKILILDEATSALDSESEFLVQKALENLMRSKTTIIIAHRLSTVKKADKILVLEQGKIIQSGSHDSLLLENNGYYKKLIDKQINSPEGLLQDSHKE